MAKVGDKVPSATLRMLGPEGPKAVTTEELFAPGKKVVAFALPGAFTPTCSAKHVPGFVAEADKLKAKGVDTIACISVNDALFRRDVPPYRGSDPSPRERPCLRRIEATLEMTFTTSAPVTSQRLAISALTAAVSSHPMNLSGNCRVPHGTAATYPGPFRSHRP